MMEDKIKCMLEEEYDMKDVLEINPRPERSVNRHWTIVRPAEYLLVREISMIEKLSRENILAQIEIMETLEAQHLPVVLPLRNKKGERLTNFGEKFVMVFPLIDAETEPEVTDARRNAALELLIKFHRSMKGQSWKNSFFTSPIVEHTIDITQFYEKYEEKNQESVIELAKKVNSPFSKKVQSDSVFISETIKEVIMELKSNSFSDFSLLHFDFNTRNMLFKRDLSGNISLFYFAFFPAPPRAKTQSKKGKKSPENPFK